jgi:hypothetical protein
MREKQNWAIHFMVHGDLSWAYNERYCGRHRSIVELDNVMEDIISSRANQEC